MSFKENKDVTGVVASEKFYFPVLNRNYYIHVFVHKDSHSILRCIENCAPPSAEHVAGACCHPIYNMVINDKGIYIEYESSCMAEIHLLANTWTIEHLAHELTHFLIAFLRRHGELWANTDDTTVGEIIADLMGQLTCSIYLWLSDLDAKHLGFWGSCKAFLRYIWGR